MLDTAGESISAMTARWLAQFEAALTAADWPAVSALFHPECHWRDVLALSWKIQTVSGGAEIVAALKSHLGHAPVSGFETDPARTPPRRVKRAGSDAIEAIFAFETAAGRGAGVLRLVPDAEDGDTFKAWTLLTALDELRGLEERVGLSRPTGEAFARDFHGPNWRDLRAAAEGKLPPSLIDHKK